MFKRFLIRTSQRNPFSFWKKLADDSFRLAGRPENELSNFTDSATAKGGHDSLRGYPPYSNIRKSCSPLHSFPPSKTAAGESPFVPKFYQTISSRTGVEGKIMNIEEMALTFSRAALLGRPC
ncbi:hypothetical protein NPIL_432311 [Nephila pilipes]|uniref:Uncharacterized protein n=1 Tax=Nephila pilipes TaxID=299642 RepID=A0A8X6UQG5_NEPPI|nr:hypothetical protein NPIL_432311 [Nephila pilipes]